IHPQRTPGACIQGRGIAWRLGNIQNAVDDKRRGLELTRIVDLVRPCRFQARDVGRVDLVERRIAVALIVARVSQPVARFTLCVENTICTDLRRQRHGEKSCQSPKVQRPPRNDARYATTSSNSIAESTSRYEGIGDLPHSLCNSCNSSLKNE